MRIGDVAAALGVGPHVLRHWESVGAVTPSRTAQGHREYDARALDQARTVHRLRQLGLSLPAAMAAMAPTKQAAAASVRDTISTLEHEVEQRRRTITFLQHTLECRHRYLDECDTCTAVVDGS